MTEVAELKFMKVDSFLSEPYGHSIRDQKNPTDPKFKPPEHHFLLYVRIDSSGRLDTRRMFDSRIKDIEKSEVELFHLARGPKGTPTYLGTGHKNMHWRFPCYFTVVLDNENWKFHWGSTRGEDPISFREELDGTPYDPNYSFYNGKLVTIPVLDATGTKVGERAAVRCENYIKADHNGVDLGENDKKAYKMDLNILQPDAHGGGHTRGTIDPDGTNQGPPGVP